MLFSALGDLCDKTCRATIRATMRLAAFCCAWALLLVSPSASARRDDLHRYEATRLSMACVYAIEMYGPDATALPGIADAALDEVDRIDRLMSHYKADSPLSRINRDAADHPVSVDKELFDFIAESMRYNRDSQGAFDITVGPLMKAWGFFRGEGHVPSATELDAARRLVGSRNVILDAANRSIRFTRPGVELDLGGIAKGYAVDRAVAVLKARGVAAALVSAGGSTIYGLGAPPGAAAWSVSVQDPVDSTKSALSIQLKDRALSVAGSSEKSFEAHGVTYSHIMNPRTGHPVQGVLSVAVLTSTGTAGDALDDAFFVLGVRASRAYLQRLSHTETLFFLPDHQRPWTMVHLGSG
jgi:FAD:protein FMN transferase